MNSSEINTSLYELLFFTKNIFVTYQLTNDFVNKNSQQTNKMVLFTFSLTNHQTSQVNSYTVLCMIKNDIDGKKINRT